MRQGGRYCPRMPIGPLLVLLAGSCWAQPQLDDLLNAHVTYTTVATTAQAAVEGLARASGAPLKASASVRPSILLLRFMDVPVREAMQRIAEACGGSTWVRDSGAFYLTRTPSDERRVTARLRAELQIQIKGVLAEFAVRAASLKPFTAAEADALAKRLDAMVEHHGSTMTFRFNNTVDFSAAQSGPGLARLSARLFSRLKPAQLLDAPSGRRTVYSTNPTRNELPLNLDLSDLIPDYIAAQQQWATTIEKYPEEDRRFLYMAGEVVQTTPPTKIDVTVDKSRETTTGLQLGIELVAPDGSIIASVPPHPLPITAPGAGTGPLAQIGRGTADTERGRFEVRRPVSPSDADKRSRANFSRPS